MGNSKKLAKIPFSGLVVMTKTLVLMGEKWMKLFLCKII